METRNSFELVDRSACVPESPAGHLCYLNTARCDYGSHYERGFVANAARRMLIDLDAAYPAQIGLIARIAHSERESHRLGLGHSAENTAMANAES